jgi:anti-sigma regulatory factor (Ser/Thr protein kinase)
MSSHEPARMSLDLSLDLPRDVTAASLARLAVRRRLAEDVDGETLGRLQIVVTELVTNAVLHGEGDIRLGLHVDEGRVTGEVVDGGGGFERDVRRHGTEALGGRGLTIVDALTAQWGVHEGTTHVWFQVDPAEPIERKGPELGEHRRPDELEP